MKKIILDPELGKKKQKTKNERTALSEPCGNPAGQ